MEAAVRGRAPCARPAACPRASPRRRRRRHRPRSRPRGHHPSPLRPRAPCERGARRNPRSRGALRGPGPLPRRNTPRPRSSKRRSPSSSEPMRRPRPPRPLRPGVGPPAARLHRQHHGLFCWVSASSRKRARRARPRPPCRAPRRGPRCRRSARKSRFLRCGHPASCGRGRTNRRSYRLLEPVPAPSPGAAACPESAASWTCPLPSAAPARRAPRGRRPRRRRGRSRCRRARPRPSASACSSPACSWAVARRANRGPRLGCPAPNRCLPWQSPVHWPGPSSDSWARRAGPARPRQGRSWC
mmetsp:Transcript_115910/g.368573  ORF Transcript_115910/g.368573 Transcript_115910/m.368573 type:complete len:300 (+) Transcript_115910:127-1026(+)